MTSLRRAPVFIALVILLAPQAAGMALAGTRSDDIEDANERVDELDDEIEVAQDDLETRQQRLASLDDELRRASESLSAADARATDAQSVADRARIAAEETREELRSARDELAEKREQLASVARDAYIHGGQSTGPLLTALENLSAADGPEELSAVLPLLDIVVVERTSVVEDTQRLLQRTVELTREARAAEEQAAEDAATADEAREEAARRNADVLALVGEADSAVREQQQQIEQLRSERSAADREADQLEEEAERAAEAADAAVTTTSISGGLASVGGITVAASLAPDLEALLEAARADGIVLTGYGYRSPETTARLRIANGCPDVHDSPASSCRIPTAPPGNSMHEQGLAIDFNYQGATICYPRSPSSCSGNAGFDWLAANAGRFGLQVLGSEAWHWSTNGE